ncbi:hypothetical protein AMECASPLE_025793 [Ameca splendens]|uniref:Uncharacterized protein n=1 Tax=Ameca splendens TaxID=208324 RepID=A0ABV0XHR0_9TELE
MNLFPPLQFFSLDHTQGQVCATTLLQATDTDLYILFPTLVMNTIMMHTHFIIISTGATGYDSRSPVKVNRRALTTRWHISDILHLHVSPFLGQTQSIKMIHIHIQHCVDMLKV